VGDGDAIVRHVAANARQCLNAQSRRVGYLLKDRIVDVASRVP
jgi:hypothetical protein